MMGLLILGPALVFGDNRSIVNGVSIPESKIQKKHLGICYHAIRKVLAAGIWKVGFVKEPITSQTASLRPCLECRRRKR